MFGYQIWKNQTVFSLEDLLLKQLARKSGFPVTVGARTNRPLSGRFGLKNVEFTNPERFPLKEFLSLAEVNLDISPGSLLRKTIHVRQLDIHLRRLTGIRNSSGAVNIEQFREALERPEEPVSSGAGRRREFVIQRLRVSVDHIATIDCTGGGTCRREYPVCFEREFNRVTNLLLPGRFLMEELAGAGLSREVDSIFATLLSALLWEQLYEAEELQQ